LSIFAQSPSPSASPTTDERFQQLASAYIEEELGSNPEQATDLGDHRFDDILTDYSHASRDRILAAQKQFKIEAGALDQARENLQHPPRARLTSAQLSTYFVGVNEHLDLREKAKAKAGAAFDLKKYND
jgi:uncharacterized protein (DUF885 family)